MAIEQIHSQRENDMESITAIVTATCALAALVLIDRAKEEALALAKVTARTRSK